MALYLALDAGGTKTEYVLADEERELARVRGGSIKRLRVDAATAERNLDAALAELADRTGLPMSAVQRTCVGAAGYSVPLVGDWIRTALQRRVGGSLVLVGDVEIALDAAFPGDAGVLIMAGTGSNVAGRGHAGRITTAGGWGPALADQASGHRIGSEALRAAFLAVDRGETSTLLPAILELWQLPDRDALVSYANATPTPDVAQLAPLTVRCALRGDRVARRLLEQEGQDLAHLAALVIGRLRQESPQQPEWLPRVALTGSILEHAEPVRTAVIAALRREFPPLEILPGIIDPILGALWRARSEQM